MRIRLRRLLVMVAMLAGFVLPTSSAAQGAGRITGRVVDAESGRPLVGAQVGIEGSSVGTLSGVDGRFILSGARAGTHTLTASFIGYASKRITGVEVGGEGTAALDISLSPAAVALEGVTVSATRERGTVSRSLDAQRTSVGVINSTTSEQIARSPDGDAAQAVQRVSGVTVRDGKYVFVRGLGERYTTTSLNGARLPSPEPEKKVVPLDLFPSNLLESITTSKTFTPDQAGDFSGARVNLQTKSFSEPMIQYSLGFGYNAGALEGDVPQAPSVGMEWLGMAGANRAMPAALAGVTDFSSLQQAQINGIVRSFRNDWSPQLRGGLPNGSASVSMGGEQPLGSQRVGYVGSLTYARSQEVRQNVVRARAIPGDAAGTPALYNEFRGSTGQMSTLWGGMLNLTTYLGLDHKLELNNTYDRTADNEAHEDWGTLEEFAQVDSVRRSSLRYVERSIRSNQLRAEHRLGAGQALDWSITSSAVTRDEPDRSDIAYGYEFAPTGERLPLAWLGFIPEAAKRTYAELDENALEGAVSYSLGLGTGGQVGTLKVGTAYRRVNRDATSSSYNIRALGLSAQERALDPGDIFLGAYTSGSAAKLTLEPNSSGGTYSARDDVAAGFAMLEYAATPWLRLVGGARVENWRLRMDSEPVSRGLVRTSRRNLDVLPSLALNFRLSDAQNLRFSAAQTLARPEYRELSPISYRDMLGEREVFGDSSLVRTLVENYDLRWELYPSSGEVLSFGVFAKRFRHPIEPIDVATSGASQLSFTNADGARNYGVEVEARKHLGFIHPALQPFTAFSNATVMRSEIRTGGSNLSALTNDDRPMVGQAPYVVNAGLTYSGPDEAASATLLYNVVGKRMVSAAVMPLNADTYEMPRHVLDFSLRLPLYGDVSGKLDARNLLGSAHEERQGEVVRYRYDPGRVLSLGISWRR
ncbi:MAG TPA: TonB-dependent receptor [Longimicrobiaceae bacterium]